MLGIDTNNSYQNRKRLKYLLTFLFIIFLCLFIGRPLLRFLTTLLKVALDFKFVVDSYHVYRVHLWTTLNSDPQIFLLDDIEGFKNSSFDRNLPIKVMFHGFSDEPQTSWVRLLRDSYLAKGKYNIISVDWQSSAESPWYNRASKNAKHAGNATAQWFRSIVDMYDLKWEDVHVIGASLGGHTAGYFGRFTNGKCGRVTGLDPSGPLFHDGPDDRLDPSDGQFVDVIHSAGRWVGNDDIQGHVDFFPNGGRASQPDCVETAALYCSHFMAWRLFGESILSPSKFLTVKCSSYSDYIAGRCCRLNEKVYRMGEDVDRSLRGTFYLTTSGAYPFYLPPQKSTNCKSIDLEFQDIH